MPLWIPWLGCGTPLHASQQAGIFYPGLTLPLLVFPANDALKFALLLHPGLAFAGQYRLCRALGASAVAASFAALVVTQSGFLVNHLMAGHVNIVVGAALVPWFLWALVRFLDSPGSSRAAVLAVIGGGFALGSQPQISYYALLFGAAWTVGWLAFARGSGKCLRAVAWLAVAGVVAVFVGAVQLLPSLELLLDGRSETPRGEEAYAATYALDARDLARLAVPNLEGNPFLLLPQLNPHDSYHERVVYLGLAAWILAAYGLTRAPASQSRLSLRESSVSFAERKTTILRLAIGLGLLISACWLIVSVFASGRTLSWYEIFNHAWSTCRSELLAGLVFLATTAAAIALARRRRQRSPGFSAAVLLAVTLSDLGYGNAANFWLEHPEPRKIPAEILAIDPPIRFVDAPHYPNIAAQPLQYSRMVETAVHDRRSMVGMSEGGILPGAWARYYRAVERNAPRALAIGACDYITHRDGPWVRLRDSLPRVRYLAGPVSALSRTPIEDLSSDELRSMSSVVGQGASSTAHPTKIEDAEGGSEITVLRDDPHRLDLRVSAAADGMLWSPTCGIQVGTATSTRARNRSSAATMSFAPSACRREIMMWCSSTLRDHFSAASRPQCSA